MATRKHKRGRSQQGGVILREQQNNPNMEGLEQKQKEAFDYFFDNSNIFLVSDKSTGGILFKLELNEGVESPYILCRSQSPWSPVRFLLLKLCCFSKKGFKYLNIQLNDFTEDEFLNEVNIQKEIYSASLDNRLEPTCPSIVFFNRTIDENTLTKIISPTLCDEENRDNFRNFKWGIIAMEYLDGFYPLGQLQETIEDTNENLANIKHYYFLVCYEMIRMFELTGYLHGDFHPYNFMVNRTYPYLSNDPKFLGRVIIIDFGKSFKPTLDAEETTITRLNYNEEITCAIPILNLNLTHQTPFIKRKIDFKQYEQFYWIKKFIDFGKGTEKKLKTFNKMRNKFIKVWQETITNGATIGGNTMEVINKSTNAIAKQPTIMVEPTQKSMFPTEFAGKFKEIQQYVAMDKLANQPNK